MTLYKRVILTKPYKSKIYKAKTLKEAINLCYEDLKNNCDDEYFSVLDIDKNEEYTFMTKKKNNNINKKMEQIEKNLDLKYSKNEDLDEIDLYLDSSNSTDTSRGLETTYSQRTDLSCNVNIPKNNKEINLIKLSIAELKGKINILDNKIGKINKFVEAKELIFEKNQLEKELSLQNKIKKEYSEKLALKEQQIRKEYIEKMEKEQRDNELILKEKIEKEQKDKEKMEKEQKDKERVLKEQKDKEQKELIEKIQKQMDNKKKPQKKCVNANDMDNWCIFM